ncbi:MAG TPA: hypothetical protein VMW18_11140, partial [Candidatus Binatia bacterium]|nr:hypothetical protein [Candidatus Binatia bacterium]
IGACRIGTRIVVGTGAARTCGSSAVDTDPRTGCTVISARAELTARAGAIGRRSLTALAKHRRRIISIGL